MRFIADFHIHSKYSRATSPQMDLHNLAKFAAIKGIRVLTPGDFTHPDWFNALKNDLQEAENGLYKIKDATGSAGETKFILTTEISCIYSERNRVRKIHIVIFAPNLLVVEKINKELSKIGNLRADGRPILGLSAKKLLEIVLSIDENCLVVPAHILTPWFGIFGSKSGFDSLEECFGDDKKYIYALETGLSADPAMIWRIPDARTRTLISNSDAHSLENLGREANVFDADLNYSSIIEAIKNKDKDKFLFTIEFFPQEGKYYYDGHRLCNIGFSPQETIKHNGNCPVCGRPLTVGVLNRVEQLADKPEGYLPPDYIPYKSIIPLKKIIGEILGVGVNSKKVGVEYDKLIESFGSEFEILLETPLKELEKSQLPLLAKAISLMREGKVKISPGYDGKYGEVSIFGQEAKARSFSQQRTLF